MTGLLGGLTALAAGAAVAFHEFEESEKLVNQTNAVLKSTGGIANVTAKDVTHLADALRDKTAVDDEVVRNGENVLLTFTNIRNEVGKGNDIFDRATRLALDMSAALGQDLKGSAIQLGKALQDPTVGLTALRRVGVSFNDTASETITKLFEQGKTLQAQKLILQEVATEFKGSAEAQKTASAAMGVALGELAEKIGKLLAPAITFLADKLVALVQFIQKEAGPAFQAAADWFKNAWEAVKPFAETIGSVLLPLFEAAWTAIRDRLIPALEKFAPLFKVIGGAVVIFAATVLAQVAIVIIAISHVIDFLGKVIDAFMKVVDWVRENLAEPIVGALQKIIDRIGHVIDWVKDRFVGAWQAALGPITAVIGKIIEWIKTLVGWIQTAVEWLGKLGSSTPAVMTPGGAPAIAPHVNPPQAQTGGFVARSGLAMIHKGENIIPAGGGGDIVLQIEGQTIARIMRDQLNRMGARNATTGLLRP